MKHLVKTLTVLTATLALLLSIIPAHLAQAVPGGITAYNTPTPESSPFDITTGSDGNLWFTEYAANKIGKINPSTGDITEYDIPTEDSEPGGITNGPDGNLWFTQWGGNKIGRITPSGTITEYSFPTPGGKAYNITTGPDGNLWFTKPDGDHISKIDPSTGTITEYPAPYNFYSITADLDGSLWVSGSSHIAKVDPDTGTITEYPDVSPGGDITTDSDGNLWLLQSGQQNGQIAKVDPGTGTVTAEYPLPPAYGEAYNIITGPDGNLWFTLYDENKIGRLEPLLPGMDPVIDLSLSKTLLNTGEIETGDSVQYKLTITNTGNMTVNKSVYPADIYPVWLDFESVSGANSCNPPPEGTVEMLLPNHASEGYKIIGCNIGSAVSLAPGEEEVVTLTFTANQAPVAGLDNYAMATAGPGYAFEDDAATYDLFNPSLWDIGTDDVIDEWLDGKLTGWNNFARAVYDPNSSSEDTNVAVLSNAETNQPVRLQTPEGTTLTCSSTSKESDLTTQDQAHNYPLGLVNFCFDTEAQNNEISLTFVTDLKPNQVTARKYNSNDNTYFNIQNATITETTYQDQPALRLTYTITDNGQLDLDPATGKIKDPVGLAVTADELAGTGSNVALLMLVALSGVGGALVYLSRRTYARAYR